MIDDQNRATGVRISWSHDEYHSLFSIGDMGLDPDSDGALTDEEKSKLSGFDMSWHPSCHVLYAIAHDPALTGGQGCRVAACAPDITEADEALKDALAEYSADERVEAGFPVDPDLAAGIGAAGVAEAFAMGAGTAAVTIAAALLAIRAREGALASLARGRIAQALSVLELGVGLMIVVVSAGQLAAFL